MLRIPRFLQAASLLGVGLRPRFAARLPAVTGLVPKSTMHSDHAKNRECARNVPIALNRGIYDTSLSTDNAIKISAEIRYGQASQIDKESREAGVTVPAGKKTLGLLSPLRGETMDEEKILERITVNPRILGGKPIIRGRRLAVEHILGMLAAEDSPETILEGYQWLEPEDIQACLVYARRLVGHERVEPFFRETGT